MDRNRMGIHGHDQRGQQKKNKRWKRNAEQFADRTLQKYQDKELAPAKDKYKL